jgi:lipopolysaccharide biosynthesis regulator YciM
VRASLLQGDLHPGGQSPEAIISGSASSSRTRPISRWSRSVCSTAYRRLERRDEGLQLLRGYLERYPSLDLLDVVFQLVLESEGPKQRMRWYATSCGAIPTLLGFDKLEAALALRPLPKSRADIDLAKGIVQGYTRRLARYRCDNCGFKARQFYWRCPACGGWETYPPKRTEEFDLTP